MPVINHLCRTHQPIYGFVSGRRRESQMRITIIRWPRRRIVKWRITLDPLNTIRPSPESKSEPAFANAVNSRLRACMDALPREA